MQRRDLPKVRRFVISDSVETTGSPDAVLERLLRPATWPQWQSEIRSVSGPERVVSGSVVGGRASMLGFNVDGQSVAVEVGQSVFEEDVVVGVGMRIRYEIETTSAGSRITHTLSSELPEGALGRVLSFFLARRLRRMQKELLEKLGRQAEAS
ncbi:MAG TPA: SRPBCC family protein [Actinomycetota bacterium]|nr:SRPBCC family protein [Actinomycetota bacterium]